jgi:hypothetical protein
MATTLPRPCLTLERSHHHRTLEQAFDVGREDPSGGFSRRRSREDIVRSFGPITASNCIARICFFFLPRAFMVVESISRLPSSFCFSHSSMWTVLSFRRHGLCPYELANRLRGLLYTYARLTQLANTKSNSSSRYILTGSVSLIFNLSSSTVDGLKLQ